MVERNIRLGASTEAVEYYSTIRHREIVIRTELTLHQDLHIGTISREVNRNQTR